MNIVEPLAVAIITGRRIGMIPMILRVVVALGSAAALLGTALASWDVPNGYIVGAVVFGLVWAVAPDSHAGLLFVAVLAMAWLTGAPGRLDAAVVITGLFLLVAHVAAALAAAMPVTARAEPRLMLHWSRPTAGIAGLVLVATAIVAALDAWSPGGSLVVTLSALILVTAGAWWWSAPSDRGDDHET